MMNSLLLLISKISSKTPVMFIFILIMAAVFRIFYLDLMEFKYDEAYTVFELTQFYAHPYLMQVGPPQSTGVYNFPLFNYIMILFSLFSRNPLSLGFAIALINTIFVAIFYLVLKRFYGNFVGVTASLLIALSPWNILFSRKIWIPDLIFPFLVIFILYLSKLIIKKEYKAALPLGICSALLIQMHASGIFFTLITLSIFFSLKINLKKFMLGLLIGFIPALPYLFRQVTSSPFCIDCVSLLNYQNTERFFDWMVFIKPIELINGLNYQIVLGKDYFNFLNLSNLHKFLNYIFYFEYLLPIFGILFILKNRRYLFLLVYILLLPLLYFITQTPSYMHYFVIVSPFIFMLISLFLKYLYDNLRLPIFKLSILCFISLIFLSQILFEFSFYNFLKNKQNINGDYGPIYSLTRQEVRRQTEGYMLLPYYEELQSYAYMFFNLNNMHANLGKYFLLKNQSNLAEEEFKKALLENQDDKFSRANIAYIYILSKRISEAEKEIIALEKQDSTLSAQLKDLLNKNKP